MDAGEVAAKTTTDLIDLGGVAEVGLHQGIEDDHVVMDTNIIMAEEAGVMTEGAEGVGALMKTGFRIGGAEVQAVEDTGKVGVEAGEGGAGVEEAEVGAETVRGEAIPEVSAETDLAEPGLFNMSTVKLRTYTRKKIPNSPI